jgi:hypothetical protein
MKVNSSERWSLSKSDTFWKDIAPGEHVLQIYENPENLINLLVSYVGTGVNAGESVIAIADATHTRLLEEKLRDHVLKLDTLVADDRLILLNAQQVLDSFLVNGNPDREKFREAIRKVIRRAKGKKNRKVRAFGEMVALLWNEGNRKATIQLEEYWDELCREENISLFCAYPKHVLGDSFHQEIDHICKAHSKIIRNTNKPLTEILYQDIPRSA